MCMSIKIMHANVQRAPAIQLYSTHPSQDTYTILQQVIESKWGRVIFTKRLSGSEGSSTLVDWERFSKALSGILVTEDVWGRICSEEPYPSTMTFAAFTTGTGKLSPSLFAE